MKKAGRTGVLVTVVEKKGHGPAIVGKKMLVEAAGRIAGTIGGGELELKAESRAMELLELKNHCVERYDLTPDVFTRHGQEVNMICGGNVALFFEYIAPPPEVFVFGAGHVGRCLVNCLQNLNYTTTVIDDRAEIASGIKGAGRVLTGDYAEIVKKEKCPDGSYLVVAGYNHDVDHAILKAIFEENWCPSYVGLLASAAKARVILAGLKGELGGRADLSIIYAPVGLDIGGQSPEEIALAIVAEIQALANGKKALNHLRRDWANIIN